MRGQHLDGDGAVQAGVGGLVDLSHAAFADLGGDGIRTEGGAVLERHDQLTGTRSVSSSNQLRTTLICGEESSPVLWAVVLIIKNRPSGATSKFRPTPPKKVVPAE